MIAFLFWTLVAFESVARGAGFVDVAAQGGPEAAILTATIAKTFGRKEEEYTDSWRYALGAGIGFESLSGIAALTDPVAQVSLRDTPLRISGGLGYISSPRFDFSGGFHTKIFPRVGMTSSSFDLWLSLALQGEFASDPDVWDQIPMRYRGGEIRNLPNEEEKLANKYPAPPVRKFFSTPNTSLAWDSGEAGWVPVSWKADVKAIRVGALFIASKVVLLEDTSKSASLPVGNLTERFGTNGGRLEYLSHRRDRGVFVAGFNYYYHNRSIATVSADSFSRRLFDTRIRNLNDFLSGLVRWATDLSYTRQAKGKGSWQFGGRFWSTTLSQTTAYQAAIEYRSRPAPKRWGHAISVYLTNPGDEADFGLGLGFFRTL